MSLSVTFIGVRSMHDGSVMQYMHVMQIIVVLVDNNVYTVWSHGNYMFI